MATMRAPVVSLIPNYWSAQYCLFAKSVIIGILKLCVFIPQDKLWGNRMNFRCCLQEDKMKLKIFAGTFNITLWIFTCLSSLTGSLTGRGCCCCTQTVDPAPPTACWQLTAWLWSLLNISGKSGHHSFNTLRHKQTGWLLLTTFSSGFS